ncbi:hypothetical protein D030_5256B, partial [Vibrio parahaemolyticus AQ3810]
GEVPKIHKTESNIK